MKRLIPLLLLFFVTTSSPLAEEMPLQVSDFPTAYWDVVSLVNASDYQAAFKKLQGKGGAKKKDSAYLYLKGLLLRHLKQYEKAEKALQASLRLKGSKSDVITELGFCYLARKNYDKAEVAFNEALWFDNLTRYSKADLMFRIGEIYQGRGKKDKARSFYQNAIKSANGHPEAALKLAEIVFSSNEKKQALSLLKGALEKAPDNRLVRVRYTEYLIANINPVTNSDGVKHAYNVISPILKEDNLSDEEIKIAVRVLLLNGKKEEAEKLIKEAKEKKPKSQVLQRLAKQLVVEDEAKNVKPIEGKTSFVAKKKKKGKSHSKGKRRGKR